MGYLEGFIVVMEGIFSSSVGWVEKKNMEKTCGENAGVCLLLCLVMKEASW